MSIVEIKNSPRVPASEIRWSDAAWSRMMRATAVVAATVSVASLVLLVSGVGS